MEEKKKFPLLLERNEIDVDESLTEQILKCQSFTGSRDR